MWNVESVIVFKDSQFSSAVGVPRVPQNQLGIALHGRRMPAVDDGDCFEARLDDRVSAQPNNAVRDI